MENKHKLTVEEIGALRHLCYQNIFSLEPVAFEINNDFNEENAKKAMSKVDNNYQMIEKLHLMAHELKKEQKTGCKYCLNNETLITFDESERFEGYVYVENGDLIVSVDYGQTIKTINFCPNCGNQLHEIS